MTDITTTETSLSVDAYGSVAFKGQSAKHLAETVDDILTLTCSGKRLYPPAFARKGYAILEYGVTNEPQSNWDGQISPAEAVALKLMADEGSAIAQSFNRDMFSGTTTSQLLGDLGGWPGDVVEGMAHLGYALMAAIGVRQKILDGEQCPKGKTFGEIMTRESWGKYEPTLRQDNMLIGRATVAKATEAANLLIERTIQGDGTDNPKEIGQRSTSMSRGIELGAILYLQVLEIVIKIGLPTTLK